MMYKELTDLLFEQREQNISHGRVEIMADILSLKIMKLYIELQDFLLRRQRMTFMSC